jgi:hypothetical protein
MRTPGISLTRRTGALGALIACMVGGVVALPTGTAVAARIQRGPSVTISVDRVKFGAQVINTESAPRRIEFISDGDQPATFGGVTIQDVGVDRAAGEFHVVTDTCSGHSFPTNASCTIEMTFKPSGEGNSSSRSARLVFTGGNISDRIGLDGDAVAALVVTPTTAELPAQPIGTTGAPFDVTLRNNQSVASAPPVITESQYVVPAPGQFVIAKNGCDKELAPLSTCTIAISFAPRKEPGQYLSVYTLNFAGLQPLRLGFTAKATAPSSKKPRS